MSASKFRCSFQLSITTTAQPLLMHNFLFSCAITTLYRGVYVACCAARPVLMLERCSVTRQIKTKQCIISGEAIFAPRGWEKKEADFNKGLSNESVLIVRSGLT